MTEPKKKTGGKWAKGTSGNPQGRKSGTGEVAKIRASIAARMPELMAAMMTRALAGDVGAARLLLERAIAPLKAVEAPQPLAMPMDGTLTAQGRAVIRAVANGDIAPGQGVALLSSIATLGKIAETDELRTRIEKLEAERGDT